MSLYAHALRKIVARAREIRRLRAEIAELTAAYREVAARCTR